MRNATTEQLREFETWLSLFTDGPIPETDEWKAWFCVAEYERADFDRIADLLGDADARGSFAFLGRDAADHAPIMRALDEAGHEVVFHSNRHHAYGDLSYEEAHDAITIGLAAFEAEADVRPDGFFAPFLDLSEGTVRAIEDVGFDWVLGRADEGPAGVDLLEPVIPFDTRLLPEHPPDAVMDRLRDEAADGNEPFLFHPPVVEYYDGLDAFASWIADVSPVTVREQLEGDGPGVVLDGIRPVRVE
ncbi:MAG: polysaccharide deacetylase family protein [Halanaeroarchaeum sp.]